MLFSIEMPTKGKTTGTTAWVAEQLKNSKITIENSTDKDICVFLKLPGKSESQCIVFYSDNNRDGNQYWKESTENENVWRIYPVWRTGTTRQGDRYTCYTDVRLFETLTPSAVELVEDFLSACEKALVEFIESDEKLKLSINVSIHENR